MSGVVTAVELVNEPVCCGDGSEPRTRASDGTRRKAIGCGLDRRGGKTRCVEFDVCELPHRLQVFAARGGFLRLALRFQRRNQAEGRPAIVGVLLEVLRVDDLRCCRIASADKSRADPVASGGLGLTRPTLGPEAPQNSTIGSAMDIRSSVLTG